MSDGWEHSILMRHSKRTTVREERRIHASTDILDAVQLCQLAGEAGAVRDDGAVGVVDGLVDHVQHVVLLVEGEPRGRVRGGVEGAGLGEVVGAVGGLEQGE